MLRGRAAPLGAALALAAGFVILRVAYRVVFGGVGGTGPVLLDLPRVPLAGPFAHLALFGPVTLGGVLGSITGALPFAALVLATGLLATLLDVRALLGRAATRGPVRVVARALLVALATFPALVDAVRRARVARELRGGRSAAGIVVPVLARTVERATAIGASMEVRGFAASSRRAPVAPGGEAAAEPLVRGRGVAVDRPAESVLRDVDLDVVAGDIVLLTGATGSGKSTLLRTIDGLEGHLGDARVSGELRVAGRDRASTPPRETALRVGSVPQDVKAGFVAATVAEEIGFALAVRGAAEAEIRSRVAETARALEIEPLLPREIGALSAGEAARVALAAALVGAPDLVLVDEPFADLDVAGRATVREVLRAHAARGGAVVVAEHRGEELRGLATRERHLAGGRLEDAPRGEPEAAPVLARAAERPGEPVAARIRGLRAEHAGVSVLRDVALDLRRGEVVAIAGPNGAGKSTLLAAIARGREPGVVEVGGVDVARLGPRERRRRVALVPERPDDLFAHASVLDECAAADRALSSPGFRVRGVTRSLLAELIVLPPDDLAALDARHPRDLSVGQRLLLALAIQAAAGPDLLLVDEPVRGLDDPARRLVATAIARLAGVGTAVVLATHDRPFADAVAHRTLSLAGGVLDPARSAS